METLLSKEETQDLYKKSNPAMRKFMEKLHKKEELIKPPGLLTTWEEAAKILKLHPVKSLPFQEPKNKRQEVANANWIMDCMCEAMNINPVTGKRWEPDFMNHGQEKWYPWYELKAGVGFSFYGSAYVSAFTTIGSRLVFPDKKTSDHAGKVLQKYKNIAFTI